jgi:hypothetical protein
VSKHSLMAKSSVSCLVFLCRIKDVPLSPPQSPILGSSLSAERFSPASCDLHDANSVVLPLGNVTLYLDKTLQALGLHTEARTSFITCVS